MSAPVDANQKDTLLADVRPGTLILAAVVAGLAGFTIWYSSALGLPSSPPSYAMGSFRFFELERSALMFGGLMILLMLVASAAAIALPFRFTFSVAGAQIGVEQVAQTGADLATKVEATSVSTVALRKSLDRKLKAQSKLQAQLSRLSVSLAERISALEVAAKSADNTGARPKQE